MASPARTAAALVATGIALSVWSSLPAHAVGPAPAPFASASSTATTPDPGASSSTPLAIASGTPSASASSAPARPAASSTAPAPAAGVVRAASTSITDPTSWGLSVVQPTSHTPGVAWLHFGGLSVTGRLTPAPAPGTVVDILRDGVDVTHASTRADGSYTVALPDTATVGSFTVQARLGATGATSPAVTLVNRMPTVTTRISSTTDSVKAAAVTMVVQPATATTVRLHVFDRRWKVTATSTSTVDGTAAASLVYGRTTIGKYYVRGQFTAPDGTAITGPAVSTSRIAQLDAVVRNTTMADVRYSYHANCPVGPNKLSTITMNYIGYDHRVHTGGQLVVRRYLVSRVVQAFAGGMAGGTPIKTMLNPNHFVTNGRADDYRMMDAGNTSAFNCRQVSGNPNAHSPHSWGYSIDINDWENPYYNKVSKRWYGNVRYATYRPASVTGLLVPSSPLVKALKAQGAKWYYGFDWQHFDMLQPSHAHTTHRHTPVDPLHP